MIREGKDPILSSPLRSGTSSFYLRKEGAFFLSSDPLFDHDSIAAGVGGNGGEKKALEM